MTDNENRLLKAENERLKKQLTDASTRPVTADQLSVVQQVQALASACLRLRDQVAELQKQLDTRNEDNRRLEKMVAQFNASKDTNKEAKNG